MINRVLPPEAENIERGNFSYTGDGKRDMDKANNLPQYSRGNQILTVERHFSDATTLHEALKQYIFERRLKDQLDTSDTSFYNRSSNTIAVTSTKEDSIV